MKSMVGQTVELDGQIVTVRKKKSFWHREERFSFALEDLSRIEAVQVDLFTVDMLALAVHLENRYYEIYEDSEGYAPLLGMLEAYFGPFPEGWHREATRTVFEENRILLWKRNPEQTACTEPRDSAVASIRASLARDQ